MSETKFGAFLGEPLFIEKAKRCDSIEAFCTLLKEYKAEATLEEAKGLLNELAGLVDTGDGELSEETLERVSGGGAVASFWVLAQTAMQILKRRGSTTFKGSSGRTHGGGGRHFDVNNSGGGGGHRF